MAATNFTPIQLYFSTTASAVPLAANLAQGELAINITDGKLYYEDGSGVVQVIATKGAGTIGGSTTQIQYNNAGALAGNAAMVFNNSTNVTTLTTLNLTNALGATFGGTAQSTYTQGDILYSSASNTLAKLGIGANTYILTSTGSIPQWVAPSSIAVLTATNLAGGLAGSVPYQSALDTTTFLAIGAANRVMTSTGTAPQWVTSLTGLTGVSSSSITNTSLTSGRVVVSTTAGLQADDADLTFDGTTLSAGGFSTVGLSTLVKTVKIGDSSFNGVAVFAAATPAKLYMGTGTVTDVTSAISATNAIGAIASLGITPIAATNTSVTYTNAATLYIAGAPSAGTNVTLTNPYSLYVAGGAAYFGGAVTVAGSLSLAAVTVTSLTDSGLTSGRVTFATTAGLLTDSANLLYSGTDLTVYGITVGRGAGAVSTNTVVGASALGANVSGSASTAIGYQTLVTATAGVGLTGVGYQALNATTGNYNTGIGWQSGFNTSSGTRNTFLGVASGYNSTTGQSNTYIGYTAGPNVTANATGSYNTAVGDSSLFSNTSGYNNTAVGYQASYSNTTGALNTAVGLNSLYANTTGTGNTAIGEDALRFNTTASYNTAVGRYALRDNTTGTGLTAVGHQALNANTTGYANVAMGGYDLTTATLAALYTNTTGNFNVALGVGALTYNTTASNNTAVGYQAGYSNTTGAYNSFLGQTAGYTNSTGSYSTYVGRAAGYLSTGTANTFVGHAAGYNSTGSANTFVGTNSSTSYGAGFAMTTGSKNTILGGYDGNQFGLDIRTSNGNVVLSDGDGNPLVTVKTGRSLALETAFTQTGLGITFPASQFASTDANTLDDYEEGTWVPNQGSGLTVVGAFSSVGRYTKIGNVVTVWGDVTGATSIAVSAVGIITTNLPIPMSSDIGAEGSATGFWTSMNSVAHISIGNLTSVYSAQAISGSATIGFTITYRF